VSHPVDGSQHVSPGHWVLEVVVFTVVATLALVVLGVAVAGVVTSV
jgi:hypothetical protein